MIWIPINPDELPEGEVLAANFKMGSYGYREKLVGWIGRINEPFCESDAALLPDVTHYIDINKFDVK